jgi:hypothetical protein
MAWEVILMEPVESWFLELCESDRATAAPIVQAIDRLEKSAWVHDLGR